MATPEARQKLTAVFVADVVGYSRLMGDDHHDTVETLAQYRDIFFTGIVKFQGRVVNAPGDSILAEFESVVDAVNCAVELQRELTERNDGLSDTRRMHFRIGVNLGDVLVRDGELFGDGVNIAARLESLAEPGGVCISRTVYDQVKSRVKLGYKYLGEQRVKNIAEPVRAYQVLTTAEADGLPVDERRPAIRLRWRTGAVAAAGVVALVVIAGGGYLTWHAASETPAEPPGAALPLPDKPSIAVMPFDNLSDDPKQEYFTAGITRSITVQLYRIPDVFVINRGSAIAYKRSYEGKPLTVQRIGRELGVRYVLEGTVQKAGNSIRIHTLLIDASTGKHLWAESYDRELKDVFAVQDEITRKVVTELGVKLTWGEMMRSLRHATTNLQAMDHYLQADKFFNEFEKDSNIKARDLLRKAIKLDPKYARAIAFLSATHLLDGRYKWVKDPARSMQLAEKLARRAVAIDDRTYLGHTLLARIYTRKRMFEQAVAEAKRSMEVEPGHAMGYHTLGSTMNYVGRPEEGLVLYRKALRMAPYPPPYFLLNAGISNYLTGRYEEAIKQYRKLLKRYQQGNLARLAGGWLIAAHMERGKEEEARSEARKFIERHPNVSIKTLMSYQRHLYKDQSIFDRQTELLRKAGLPD